MAELAEQAVVADEAGVALPGVGEHHRSHFVASTPLVVLAAVAMRTKNIRLTSGVTVLGSEDPVRVFQNFRDRLSGLRRPLRNHRRSRLGTLVLNGEMYSHIEIGLRDIMPALKALAG
nr:LLM class flavin-dependent oxidoreductase [Actinoplanes polyasparticus]